MTRTRFRGITALLLLSFLFPVSAQAVNWRTIQSEVRNHLYAAASHIRQKNWGMCEKELDQGISALHRLKRKCRGIFKTCRITDKDRFYKTFAKPYASRGYCRFMQGKNGPAKRDANTSINWDENFHGSYLVLVLVHYKEGNITEAKQHYRKLIKLKPEMRSSLLVTMPRLE